MTDKPKPAPYKFCDSHMRPSTGPNRCHECFGSVANPVNDEPQKPVQNVNTVSASADIPECRRSLTLAEALTDPTAQKVVEVAQSYARAIEAVSVITGQVRETRELLMALETKLKETKQIATAAQDELRNATTVKPA